MVRNLSLSVLLSHMVRETSFSSQRFSFLFFFFFSVKKCPFQIDYADILCMSSSWLDWHDTFFCCSLFPSKEMNYMCERFSIGNHLSLVLSRFLASCKNKAHKILPFNFSFLALSLINESPLTFYKTFHVCQLENVIKRLPMSNFAFRAKTESNTPRPNWTF